MSRKIAIVINNTQYAYWFRLNLARAIKKQGYQLFFIAPYDKKYTPLLKREFEFCELFIKPNRINFILDARTIFEIYSICKKNKIDLVLNFTIKPNIYSSYVAKILKIDSISNITGLGSVFIQKTFLTKIVTFLYRQTLSSNRKVFFQNKDDREIFLTKGIVNYDKTEILPGSGVDIRRFSPKPKSTQNQKFVFLMISRLLKDKGVYELIEATRALQKKHENIEVWIVGEVDEKNKNAISKAKLDIWIKQKVVKYLGVTDEVESIIKETDCVLLPSYREGVPRSLLEACAMSKPTIATDVEGCKDVVRDGINGYLCEAKDPKDLFLKMEKMYLLEESKREKLGQKGREIVKKEFGEAIVIERYLAAIKDLDR